jgi:hypothetical protein
MRAKARFWKRKRQIRSTRKRLIYLNNGARYWDRTSGPRRLLEVLE